MRCRYCGAPIVQQTAKWWEDEEGFAFCMDSITFAHQPPALGTVLRDLVGVLHG